MASRKREIALAIAQVVAKTPERCLKGHVLGGMFYDTTEAKRLNIKSGYLLGKLRKLCVWGQLQVGLKVPFESE